MKFIISVIVFSILIFHGCLNAQYLQLPAFANTSLHKSGHTTFQKWSEVRGQRLDFRPPTFFNYGFVNSSPFQKNEIMPMPNGVCYTAFFCKMEVNVRNRFNIWVKMRVGDFDSYDKK